MGKWVAGILTRFFVVMALMLGGWTPVSAHTMTHTAMAHTATGAMAMMPGMPMHHDMAAKHISAKEMPARHMPCCDDGCCVAGSCAGPLPPLSATWVEPVGAASEIFFDNALAAGITFPPSLRPPIPRA